MTTMTDTEIYPDFEGLDSPDDATPEHGQIGDPDSGAPRRTATRGKAKSSKNAYNERIRRATITATITKVLQVGAAPEHQREVAAAILGCSADVAELTTVILTSGRSSTRAVDDIIEVAHADDLLEAGIAASMVAEDKNRLAAAWNLARSLGLDLPNSPLPSTAKAAAAFGRAVYGLDADLEAQMRETLELLA